MDDKSIVQYIPESSGHKCGYCKSRSGSKQIGLWAFQMTVTDYQSMIDRGWRRCGHYCYKPILSESCCALYTIRCDGTDFKLRQSQKKVLKNMQVFLESGDIRRKYGSHGAGILNVPLKNAELMEPKLPPLIEANELIDLPKMDCTAIRPEQILTEPKNSGVGRSHTENQSQLKSLRKAKKMRIIRKKEKLMSRGLSGEELEKKMLEKKKYPIKKNVEDLITESPCAHWKNRLEVRLVRSSPPSEQFQASSAESYELYCKYQINVHKDDPDSLSRSSYERFLVRSPLIEVGELGSFHQQYWLNGELVAVGVVDILPFCISSVYFFYDPDYSYLSLGTYSSLREVHLLRSLNVSNLLLKFYYMGFYIKTCPKMRYKGLLNPSYLLCPEVYTWHPIADCLQKLEPSRYARLNSDQDAWDENEGKISDLGLVLLRGKLQRLENMPSQVQARSGVLDYTKNVGAKCCNSIILYFE